MVSLETLIEQTDFLLGKQKEAQKDCLEIFGGLLEAVQKKLVKVKGQPEEVEALKKVHTLVSEQIERVQEDTQSDIEFLTEQLSALREIGNIKDKKKIQELVSQMVDDSADIKETAAFKKEVEDESKVSRQNLVTLVNDIREAVSEDSAKDVALYLESILGEEETEEDEEDGECCGGDCHDDEESSCKGCSRGCCGSNDEGADIFAALEEISVKEAKKKK
ncbi:MAG: hypothetical protein WCW33_04455 [Candidatus Babeliales bacterium]